MAVERTNGQVVVEKVPREETADEYLGAATHPLPQGGRRLSSRVGKLGDFVTVDGNRWQVVNEKGKILAPV
jgi:hypothetical protein